MAQRLIGDILRDRRESLGLSIDRVVEATKLQPRAIEAFERSDFEAMPPKGYARATLASYARYLGLEPADVLRIYEEQLYRYQHGDMPSDRSEVSDRASTRQRSNARSVSSRERSQRERDYDRRETTGRTTRASGLYDIPVRDRSQRYRSEATYGRERSSSERSRTGTSSYDYRPESYSTERLDSPGYRSQRSVRETNRSSTGRERTRLRDDRFDESIRDADGYEGGSGGRLQNGRDTRSSRGVQPQERMNMSEALNGIASGLSAFFRENRLAALVMGGVIVVLIVVIIVLAVSSCTRRTTDTTNATIPVTQVSASTSQESTEASTAVSAQAASSGEGAASSANDVLSAATGTAGETETATTEAAFDLTALPANSTLTFTVSSDVIAPPWIEVTADGAGVFANQTSRGESESFTFNSSITIKLTDAEGVSVTINGIEVQPTVDETGMATLTGTCVASESSETTAGTASTVGTQTSTTGTGTATTGATSASGTTVTKATGATGTTTTARGTEQTVFRTVAA